MPIDPNSPPLDVTFPSGPPETEAPRLSGGPFVPARASAPPFRPIRPSTGTLRLRALDDAEPGLYALWLPEGGRAGEVYRPTRVSTGRLSTGRLDMRQADRSGTACDGYAAADRARLLAADVLHEELRWHADRLRALPPVVDDESADRLRRVSVQARLRAHRGGLRAEAAAAALATEAARLALGWGRVYGDGGAGGPVLRTRQLPDTYRVEGPPLSLRLGLQPEDPLLAAVSDMRLREDRPLTQGERCEAGLRLAGCQRPTCGSVIGPPDPDNPVPGCLEWGGGR